MNDENFLFAVLIGYLIGSSAKKSKGTPIPVSTPYQPKPGKPVVMLPGGMVQKKPALKVPFTPFKIVK